jgi:hypothetical protein
MIAIGKDRFASNCNPSAGQPHRQLGQKRSFPLDGLGLPPPTPMTHLRYVTLSADWGGLTPRRAFNSCPAK